MIAGCTHIGVDKVDNGYVVYQDFDIDGKYSSKKNIFLTWKEVSDWLIANNV